MQVLVPPEVRSRHPARFNPGPAAPAASTAPKLRDRMREQIRLEGKSPNTAAVYWHWTKGYIRFHGLAHPQDLGADDVRRYLNHLVNDRQVSKNTHGQALHALHFAQVAARRVRSFCRSSEWAELDHLAVMRRGDLVGAFALEHHRAPLVADTPDHQVRQRAALDKAAGVGLDRGDGAAGAGVRPGGVSACSSHQSAPSGRGRA